MHWSETVLIRGFVVLSYVLFFVPLAAVAIPLEMLVVFIAQLTGGGDRGGPFNLAAKRLRALCRSFAGDWRGIQ